MSIFSKNALSSFFGLSGDDDGYEVEEKQAANMKTRAMFQPRQDQSIEPLTEKPSARYRSTESRQDMNENRQDATFDEKKVVSMHNANYSVKRSSQTSGTSNKIMIIEPRVYSEAMNIAKHIIANEAVLLNFHLVEELQARRIVDFLTGTVYAIDGDIQRVGDEIFLCTPSNMEIDSATAQSLAKQQAFDF